MVDFPNEAENTDSATQVFDDELDELVAFNSYVENILQNYLEDSEAEITPLSQPTEIDPDNVVTLTEEIVEIVSINNEDQDSQDPKYLAQEVLVDKFLARLEELNIGDRANKESTKNITPDSNESIPEIDEFADLEALLDRKPLPEN